MGWLKVKAHKKQVWVWNHEENQARQRTLVITKGGDVKYMMSNVIDEQTTLQKFVFMGSQRYFIERAFGDGKGELGLRDYQIRKYRSWYHHQALVMLAMNFVLQTKIKYKSPLPLLSVRDVRMQIIEELKHQGVHIEKEIDQMLINNIEKIICSFQAKDFVLSRGTKIRVMQGIMRIFETKNKSERLASNV